MKVLVTGGAGFIGSHLVDALRQKGHRTVVVDDLSTGRRENLNPNAIFYHLDIRESHSLEQVFIRERPEVVFHLAAQTDVRLSMEDPAFDAQVNVLGLVNLLQHCIRYRVGKVVFASSSAVYPEPEAVPVPETHPVRPLSAYGLTKYMGERYLEFYRDVYGLRFTSFRYGNVFGPRQNPQGETGVVAIFSQQISSGIQPTLFGDGNKTRDYIYVEDVVSANLLVMDGAGDGEVFNLGWGQEVKDVEVFETIRKVLDVQVEPRYAEKRPGELERISLDCQKAKRELGWVPKVSFQEGIRRSVEFYCRCSS